MRPRPRIEMVFGSCMRGSLRKDKWFYNFMGKKRRLPIKAAALRSGDCSVFGLK
jgi:hypothetical protein